MSSIAYSIDSIRELTKLALQSLGYCEEDAIISTDVLMYAELRGNNQGKRKRTRETFRDLHNILLGLIKLVTRALIPNPNSTNVRIVRESKVSAQLDGGQRIGMVVVHRGVEIAIQKAKEHGIAVVGCSNYSSATGALGVWAKKITDAGLVGIVLSQV